MTHPARDPAILDAVALLNGYGFDMDGFAADYLVSYWAVNHPAHWIRAAIVEALYQGRYRAVSVGQILAVWRRRGQPIPHYTPDFERVVSGRFGGFSAAPSASATISQSSVSQSTASQTPARQNQSTSVFSSESALDEPGSVDRAIAPPSESELADTELPADQSDPSADPSGSDSQLDSRLDPQPNLQSAPPLDPQEASEPSNIAATNVAATTEDQPGPTENEDAFGWWGRGSVAQNPIHQYVPIIPRIEASAFYAKLRAVACGGDEAGEGAVLVADGQRLAQPSILRNSPLLDSMEQAQLGEQN
ncbi:hypothetical protein P7L53_17735 [Thermoleptolyngbya sichuanensis XZ-Cy5]|uniref:hypothetical protein n=1 Tax=Thermoleptolyngbya sichuanensis TaxID=2885951 RepID=UPI00240E25CD|nr:hypothetical protein [Thermoleptolyngbya sichuanensis]MDG2618085.1 hypothetical protein [Thermoleptolyngbya sichuanensis XZ-Cy5]